ncbi:hypothetical protein [Brevundimonas sp.]|uniref:hypothetical protein n=1 Tax=Brevundimonas sp. TaxID=1871086 RepID=UPI0025D5A716|nr:hypothetical protein [Brevundimonas sp.]
MRIIRHFRHDTRGAAAIELAIIAPVLAGMGLLALQVWKIGVEQQQAAAALDVAADYYLQGGLSDETAAQAARDAWADAPADAVVGHSRSARCGADPVEMTSLCSGGRAPAVYVTLTASGSNGEGGETRVRATRMIRVR